jgi:hypothetical protein
MRQVGQFAKIILRSTANKTSKLVKTLSEYSFHGQWTALLFFFLIK